MSRQGHAEDLLVLARQGKLSEEEERRFEIALQSSRELECLYGAGVQFDAEAALLSGDEARLSRLVARTLERVDEGAAESAKGMARAAGAGARPARASLVARYFAVSLGFGLLLCVTLASAWDYVEKRAAQQRAAEQAQMALQQSAHASARHRSKPAVAPLAPPPVPPLATESVPSAASADSPRPMPTPINQGRKPAADDTLRDTRRGEPQTSSELFARANEARRYGDVEQAISLYERLAQAFPHSVEAEDAKILRGNLLLSQRSPRAALRQFEDYRSGALSLEALWGRAQALRKLESPDERAVLLELIRDYPASPYADAAQKRLRELGVLK
jgi:TolA-binding protein